MIGNSRSPNFSEEDSGGKEKKGKKKKKKRKKGKKEKKERNRRGRDAIKREKV